MRILAFESSARAASVALCEDGALIGESYLNCGKTHSATLMQMASDLIRCCGMTASDVDAVAVAKGPGSFTGVRIGMAAAKGFAWGREIPCFGVSTLEAMARCHAHEEGILCAVMDARRSQVYNALFEGGTFRRLTEDRAISLEELSEELKKVEKKKILIGDGAELCYNTLRDRVEELFLLPEHLRQQRASGVALAAAEPSGAGASAFSVDAHTQLSAPVPGGAGTNESDKEGRNV